MSATRRWATAAMGCLVAVAGLGGLRPAAGQSAQAGAPDDATTLLDAEDTFWRWRTIGRPAVLVAQPGAAERTALDGKKLSAPEAERMESELPAGWASADFDDSAWPRTAARRLPSLAFLTDSSSMGGQNATFLKTGLLVLRARFKATDPSAIRRLSLALSYRGGVVVYLNGRQVARAGLPEGPLSASTPGLPYPDSAYLDAAGKPLPEPRRVNKDDKESADRIASRDRLLGPIDLPSDAVRPGVNVLAIELHRSDYHLAALHYPDSRFMAAWMPCGLTALRLSLPGGGAEPNTGRPRGVQVWNQDRNDRTSAFDYGDPNEPLRPIVLAGARNGSFSGKVVVSSDQPLEGVRAEASPLTRDAAGGGEANPVTIPASVVQVRYSEPIVVYDWRTKWVEPMNVAPPARVVPEPQRQPPQPGAVVPVWLTVHVPGDAPAGDYAGTLAITASGGKLADVPVRLRVADWTVPDPARFRTFVGLYQSPTAVALTYNVPMWSDRHWELMDRSMMRLGELGTQLVQVPVVEQTKLGNDEGMVFWVKKPEQSGTPATAAGPFDYDFSVLERYLKLVKKHLGVPRFVVLHVYHAGGWTEAGPKQVNTVTVVDSRTGQREHLQTPEFGTEQSKAFWTPVLTGLKERLAAEGMGKSLCLGSLCEKNPTPAECTMFRDIVGEVAWMRITHQIHGRLERPHPPLPGGGLDDFHIFTYLPGLPDPAVEVPPVHAGYWPRVAYYRRAQGASLPLVGHRLFAARALFLRLPGFSHMGLDYWPVPQGRRERGGLLYGRWPRANNYPGDPEPSYLTWPGPDGAEAMTAFESVREGIQEAEAMIVISEALQRQDDPLDPELARRCREALTDMLVYCRERDLFKYQHVFYHMNHDGWQELSGRLFELAAQVSRRSGR